MKGTKGDERKRRRTSPKKTQGLTLGRPIWWQKPKLEAGTEPCGEWVLKNTAGDVQLGDGRKESEPGMRGGIASNKAQRTHLP